MSTPPSAPAPIVGSTPQSKGSGSHQNYASNHTQKDYAPYLVEDLTHERTITVAQFLEWILRTPNSQDTNTGKMENDPEFKKYMDMYNRRDTFKHETDLYQPFVELANHCIGEAKIQFCRNDPTFVRGSDAQRKPDVVTIWKTALALGDCLNADNLSKKGPDKDSAFHWMELIAFWEFKFAPGGTATRVASTSTVPPRPLKAAKKPPPPPSSRERRPKIIKPTTTTRSIEERASNSAQANPEKGKDPRVQCASYALELLTYGGLRSHVIGALITNNSIELLYYDRSIIVKSEILNLAQDTALFISMLKRVAHLTENQWGYHPFLNTPHPTKLYSNRVLADPFRDIDIKLNDGRSLIMGETIFQSHGIVGRGTCVSGAEMEVEGEKKEVVVKWSWPAKTRTPEADFVKEATEKATAFGNFWVLDHLPKILHSEQREFASDSPQQCLATHFGDNYEVRVLRIVVQDVLHPITELTTAGELGEAFRGIFKCYRWLYEKAGIMHRDISRNNLMYRKINGKVYGVLNDFDLSVVLNGEPRSTSKQRTGTEPYMALDLLEPGPTPHHLYRFDLESLFYVIVCVVCQYHEGKKINDPPFTWDHLPTKSLLAEKRAFFMAPIPEPTPNFLRFKTLNVKLQEIFHNGYSDRVFAQDDQEFDNDTLGGNVNFNKFEAILDDYLPSLS